MQSLLKSLFWNCWKLQFPCKSHSGYVTLITMRFIWCQVKVTFKGPKWVLLLISLWYSIQVLWLWTLNVDTCLVLSVLKPRRQSDRLDLTKLKRRNWACWFSYVRESHSLSLRRTVAKRIFLSHSFSLSLSLENSCNSSCYTSIT